MIKIPLDENFFIIGYPDGSTSLQYKGKTYINLSLEEQEYGWKTALQKGVIKRPGMQHLNNVTSFGISLAKLLQ